MGLYQILAAYSGLPGARKIHRETSCQLPQEDEADQRKMLRRKRCALLLVFVSPVLGLLLLGWALPKHVCCYWSIEIVMKPEKRFHMLHISGSLRFSVVLRCASLLFPSGFSRGNWQLYWVPQGGRSFRGSGSNQEEKKESKPHETQTMAEEETLLARSLTFKPQNEKVGYVLKGPAEMPRFASWCLSKTNPHRVPLKKERPI